MEQKKRYKVEYLENTGERVNRYKKQYSYIFNDCWDSDEFRKILGRLEKAERFTENIKKHKRGVM